MPIDESYSPAIATGRQVLFQAAHSLMQLSEQLGDTFEQACALLKTAPQLLFTGVGKSALIAQKLAATFTATGKVGYFIQANEALHGDLGYLRPQDVLVALSFSGETQELHSLLPWARQLKARVLLMTAQKDASLAQFADIVLTIGRVPEACPIHVTPTTSTTTMLCLGDALAMALFAQQEQPLALYQRNHPGGNLGRRLLPARCIMRTGNALPQIHMQAQLRDALEEMSRQRAGAVIVVDQERRLQGIFTDGDLRRHMLNQSTPINSNTAIVHLMHRAPHTVGPETRLEEVARLLQVHQIDQVPVINDQSVVVGLIDIQDCMMDFTVKHTTMLNHKTESSIGF